jgi:uncharacterized membrane protein YGL010W
MSGYFNLEKSFGFYGAFHSNHANKLIHMICVPLIFISSIELLLRIAPVMVVRAILLFYAVSFIKMHPLSGLLYIPVLSTYYWIASEWLVNWPDFSISLFTISWIAQFVGHGLIEKRAPALLTNLPQSLHAAVFFVWLETLFSFGLLKELETRLLEAVKKAQQSRHFA